MKIVGVTKCPVGIAHTYLAAEKLEKAAKALQYEVKIETQGAQGTENKLTPEDVASADYVIVAADVAIEGKERFNGKKTLVLPIKDVIKDASGVLQSLPTRAQTYSSSEEGTEEGEAEKKESSGDVSAGKTAMKQLMNGVSYMIPFVVVGGLFIAVSISCGGTPTAKGMVVSPGFWSKVNQIGSMGFNLMIPILAGFIAYAISGRAALAPAMISAMVANSKEILGTSAGTGFLGAILVGYLAGYLVKWMNSWRVSKSLRPVMPIFVIPILGTAAVSAALILFLGAPISWLMTALNNALTFLSKNPATAIPLGLLLGAMIGVDMGGPINKVAFLFGTASIVTGTPQIMGAVACAIPVPPLAMGLATLVGKKCFDEEERAAGIPALLMGLIGITEGAIPFASCDPKRAIPSIVVGSSVASALGMVLGITDVVPHGGPIVGFLGATNSLPLFLLTIGVGTVVSMLMVIALKSRKQKKEFAGKAS
ncbi:PTS fructose transporter subunit IIC [Caproicibacterium lactatifermentans]|uniref:PTS fructose transporter subunit IIBC n=1 Tax=Caproicibacterium lactatifermentans TaxID=2666138 RepID=A0A859DQW0_9FIRM|nr:PTS fructose transporter subunit IIBC [Caproicibacterium lactatifermentans]QKN23172.1 PTS fructose transporter subunit IIBC [Caproicibacterium lactatifermentans]